MYALEAQVKQLGSQAAQDCERLTKDKTLTLQLLHKVSVPEDAHGGALCAAGVNGVFLGARKAVCTGEEVPSFNRRPELPQAQQQHPGGEQRTPTYSPRRHCSFQLL